MLSATSAILLVLEEELMLHKLKMVNSKKKKVEYIFKERHLLPKIKKRGKCILRFWSIVLKVDYISNT